jgi:F0F1-type ATP synthase assembly protein I
MEASLREREKEVQRTLATHLRDRDKEREQHKHDEAVQHFNALLADLVSGVTFAFHVVVTFTLRFVCVCKINSDCHLPHLRTP